MSQMVPHTEIETIIHEIRGRKVILDSDLAAHYEVESGQLKRAVRRNLDRFPDDFMFELTGDELESLRCQIGTSSWGGLRYLPFAFTEQGVAMLSSVLNSKRAVLINIQIMRAFVRIRNLVADNTEIRKTIQNIERRLDSHDRQIQIAFATLKNLLQPKVQTRLPEYSPDGKKKMGFGKK